MANVNVDPSKSLEVILLLVGNKGVGKTTIVTKLLKTKPGEQGLTSALPGGEALLEQCAGHAVQSWQHKLLEDGKLINIVLWDPVGCKSGSDIDVNYFALADAAIIMFDCTNKRTFSAIESWHRYVLKSVEKDILMFVLGTNYDSRHSTVDPREVRRLSRTLGVMKTFILTTEIEPDVEDIFRTIIQHVMNQREQKQCVVMEPRVTDFPPSSNRWVNFVRSFIHGIIHWVHPHYYTYGTLMEQEETTSSGRIEEEHYLDPQMEGQISRKGYATFSKTPRQTVSEVEENEDNVRSLPGTSTSSAMSQPLGAEQHSDNSTYVSISPQGTSNPLASSSYKQSTTDKQEVTTVTIEAEVYDHKQSPRKESESLPHTESSNSQATQFLRCW